MFIPEALVARIAEPDRTATEFAVMIDMRSKFSKFCDASPMQDVYRRLVIDAFL